MVASLSCGSCHAALLLASVLIGNEGALRAVGKHVSRLFLCIWNASDVLSMNAKLHVKLHC